MPVWLLIICMILAGYRATRLATRDDFPPLLWLRDRLSGGWRPLSMKEHEALAAASPAQRVILRAQWTVVEVDDESSRYVRRAGWVPYWLAELVGCPWCMSGWVAAGVTAAVALTVGVPAPLLVWGAVWAGSALLASREWA